MSTEAVRMAEEIVPYYIFEHGSGYIKHSADHRN